MKVVEQLNAKRNEGDIGGMEDEKLARAHKRNLKKGDATQRGGATAETGTFNNLVHT